MGWYDRKLRRVRDLSCGDTRVYLELEVRRLDCRGCGKVKIEQLDFLTDGTGRTSPDLGNVVGMIIEGSNNCPSGPGLSAESRKGILAIRPTVSV